MNDLNNDAEFLKLAEAARVGVWDNFNTIGEKSMTFEGNGRLKTIPMMFWLDPESEYTSAVKSVVDGCITYMLTSPSRGKLLVHGDMVNCIVNFDKTKHMKMMCKNAIDIFTNRVKQYKLMIKEIEEGSSVFVKMLEDADKMCTETP